MQPIEIKSGASFTSDWLRSVNKWHALAGDLAAPGQIIWGGTQSYTREASETTSWQDLPGKLATQVR